MGLTPRTWREREPSPGIWLAQKVDDLGYSLYVAIIFLELLVIWMQYA